MQLRQQKGDTGKIKENPNTRAGSIKPKGEISLAQDRVKGPMETDGLPLSGRETTLAPKSMAHGRVELFADTNTGFGVTEYSLHPPPPPQKT